MYKNDENKEVNFTTEEEKSQGRERSKREDSHINGDPHLDIKDVNDMTKEEMKQKMMEMEDIIIRQYIEMTSCYICPKCVRCGALNSMET